MKKRILPILLLVSMYLYFIIIYIYSEYTGPLSNELPVLVLIHFGFVVAIFIPNMVFALNMTRRNVASSVLLFWDMLLKLCQIPLYALVLLIGVGLSLHGVGIFLMPLIIAFGYLLLVATSMYGVSGLIQARREGKITTKEFVLNIVLHFIFCADVISAIAMYIVVKTGNKKLPYMIGTALIIVVVCALIVFSFVACHTLSPQPKTVAIDGTTYRSGFYTDLWLENVAPEGDPYSVRGDEYYRVDHDEFDWVFGYDMLYCAESQWEQARKYYEDNDNFVYYCKIGAQYEDREPIITTIANIDSIKFDELMTFAESNSYNPFGSNNGVETFWYPIPDRDTSPGYSFYKQSNDGFFTSFQGDTYYVIDGKLLLVFYYDLSRGENGEVAAVNVPQELGQYFVDLLNQI